MIKILKQCPITFNGNAFVELLVNETEGCVNPCSRCCYRDYVPDDDLEQTCSDVHGCDFFSDDYFILA